MCSQRLKIKLNMKKLLSVVLAGTDRHNLVQILDRNDNFPMPFEQSTMWNNMEVMWIYYNGTNWSPKDVALNMASSGHYRYNHTYLLL